MTKNQYRIDSSDIDKKYLEDWQEEVRVLTEAVIEMMSTNKVSLLSPVMRGMLADAAERVKLKHSGLRYKLCVDNPGQDLGT